MADEHFPHRTDTINVGRLTITISWWMNTQCTLGYQFRFAFCLHDEIYSVEFTIATHSEYILDVFINRLIMLNADMH